MCNSVEKHSDSHFEEIPANGKGWKIFYKKDKIAFSGSGVEYRHKDNEGYFTFYSNYVPIYDDGFCFFKRKDIAQKALKFCRRWSKIAKLSIVKITYKDGVGSFITSDPSWPKGTRFAIAKKFKIIK